MTTDINEVFSTQGFEDTYRKALRGREYDENWYMYSVNSTLFVTHCLTIL